MPLFYPSGHLRFASIFRNNFHVFIRHHCWALILGKTHAEIVDLGSHLKSSGRQNVIQYRRSGVKMVQTRRHGAQKHVPENAHKHTETLGGLDLRFVYVFRCLHFPFSF